VITQANKGPIEKLVKKEKEIKQDIKRKEEK